MRYIRSLFKAVALFCLSAVLYPGCKSSRKKDSEVKVSSKEKAKTTDKTPVQSGNKKASQNEIKPLQQPFMPPHSTPSQNINQEKRKKVLEFLIQQTMVTIGPLCQELIPSDQKIKDLIKILKGQLGKLLEEVLNALPSGEQKLLLDCFVKCKQVMDEYNKQLGETLKQVHEKYKELDNLIKKGENCEIGPKVNGSDPIFQDIIKAAKEVGADHEFIIKWMKMEQVFPGCSSQEQATYLPHLKDIRSLLMSSSAKNQKLLIQMQEQSSKVPAHVLEQIKKGSIQILEKLKSIHSTKKQSDTTYNSRVRAGGR
ncbi:hypothetical protein [Cardinium endosymbiont of Sogatella furcifera]|uniref:hypothetical protein n=1 Tax=Cardinium endosymbiont of Sogatella furcifera TaxID=650378 RepID=UPI0013B3B29E|nr:hypothetical protein [Cardinium endosymbiont of Sogatella furcifera]